MVLVNVSLSKILVVSSMLSLTVLSTKLLLRLFLSSTLLFLQNFRVLIRRSLTHATLTNVLANGKKKLKIWLDVSSRTSLNLLVTKLVRLWLLLVRNSNWRIRYNMEGGSISNRLFYCYTVSFYEKEYCLFIFFSYICQNETIYF